MNANELADKLDYINRGEKTLDQAATMLRNQQALIENLNGRIERMIENASHHEGIAHAGGFEQGHEVGRQLGMKQERALWNLSESTQEIMNTHPVKELTMAEIEDFINAYGLDMGDVYEFSLAQLTKMIVAIEAREKYHGIYARYD